MFYFLYGFTAFGVPWVMFVCLAIFFGMGGHVRDVPAMCLSALAGCVWGKVDFLLMDLFQNLGLGLAAASFVSITLGTAVTMVLHIHVLARTPFPPHALHLRRRVPHLLPEQRQHSGAGCHPGHRHCPGRPVLHGHGVSL